MLGEACHFGTLPFCVFTHGLSQGLYRSTRRERAFLMPTDGKRENEVQEGAAVCDPIGELQAVAPQVLPILLKDRTANRNILFATDAYAERPGCGPRDSIKVEHFRGGNALSIRPRAAKSTLEQRERTRQMAEVFTPTWLCNAMNNVLDEYWFGQADAFNTECMGNDWATTKRVPFTPVARWRDYVASRRLEITCGEAPFLVSRYDTATGEPILPLKRRIGLLDRKLRVVNEHTRIVRTWLEGVRTAFRSCYGYEFQGDSLLLARANLFLTFWDHYLERWGQPPPEALCAAIATTISWNLWQMDGFTNRPPFTAKQAAQGELFATSDPNACDPCRIRVGDQTLSVNNLQGEKTMKFDFIIGNPPYQAEGEGKGRNFAAPIYHYFMDVAYALSDKVLLIHPARFLFDNGETPAAWNKKMLADKHFKVVNYSRATSVFFPGSVEIKGGVAITYRDTTKDFGAIGMFMTDDELRSIKQKVCDHPSFESIVSIVFTAYAYHFTEALYVDHPELKGRMSKGHDYDLKSNVLIRLPEIFFAEKPEDGEEYIQVYGKSGRARVLCWVRKAYVNEPDNLAFWKVFLPGANGGTSFGERLASPTVFGPFVGATETFASVGRFKTQAEAEACLKYIKTKFVRAMRDILKVTQNGARDVWNLVPLQDFTERSDIDWSKSVAEIDRQLYRKYKLSADEVRFIESKVKEMA